ncbi:MAG TPA: hypothetical protein VMI54_09400 [Polyangiaceae bacterium]|nr:hypothetical protein [Polyangiaceae bacterium]
MNDPVRLLEVGADEFEAELLRAGRSDAMSGRSRKQILAGIGIGGLLTASTVATGVRAAAKTWLVTAGVGTMGALAVWAGVHALSVGSKAIAANPRPASQPVAARVVPTAEPTPAPAADPVGVATPDPEPVPPAAPARVAHAAPAADQSLSAELGAIEQARTALLNQDYAQTLRLLDDYAHHFAKHRLRSEATVLRIEALAGRGDKDAATRVGREFLQNHPNGPYAQRVRSVIGDAAPSTRAE